MKKRDCFASLMFVFVAVGVLLLLAANAAANTVTRPIGDFVSQQGTFCVDDGSGGCLLFVPPVANHIGWNTPGRPQANQPPRCASVDYTGLTNAWLISQGLDLGTQTDGTILERPLPDGRAEVTVLLHTTKALTFVTNCVGSYATAPLLFGKRATDVVVGAQPALADSFLKLVFTNTAPGAPLPDLVGLVRTRFGDIKSVGFYAQATGELRAAFGVPDGTPGRATIVETALFNTGWHGATADGFPAEMVNLEQVGK